MKNLTEEFILKYKNNEVQFAKCGSKLIKKSKKSTAKMFLGGTSPRTSGNTVFSKLDNTPVVNTNAVKSITPIVGTPAGVPYWSTIAGYTQRTGIAPGVTEKYIFNPKFENAYNKATDRLIPLKDAAKFGIYPGSERYKQLEMYNNQYLKK